MKHTPRTTIRRNIRSFVRVAPLCAIISGLALPVVAEPSTDGNDSLWRNLSSSLTTAYDSRYILYGYSLSRHLLHASLNGYLPLNQHVSVWAGTWYGYLTDGTYREWDLYAGIDAALAPYLTVGAGYSRFGYLEVPFPSDSYANEWMVHMTLAQGPLSLRLSDQYDDMADGHLVRVTAQAQQTFAQSVTATLSSEYGHAFDYFIDGNAANHLLVRLELAWQGRTAWTLKPFVAYSIPLDAIDAFEDEHTQWGLHADYAF